VAYQIRGLLAGHDRDRFEIFGYACNPDDGTPYRRRLADACDHFRDLHAATNPSIARQINADGVQILVDLSGHSRDNRLGIAALRPAPVQVGYLGFLGTTGADFVDYVLADPIVVPPAHAVYYTEKIAYLPYCYQANDDQMPMVAPSGQRSLWALPDQAFVYCSFNQPYKIDARLFGVWMAILRRVDHGVLWLAQRSALARVNLSRAAEQARIDPARLIFAGFAPLEQNLARLQLADLVLDTLIYNGGATTANALWAGVPVLSTLGAHWVSRMSASALEAVGLPELIAGDLDEYEELAVALAREPLRLGALRDRLRKNRIGAPLFNTRQFTRHVEEAYARMWHRHAAGLAPQSFRVAP
jgi:protein O-GlcNAc transferase